MSAYAVMTKFLANDREVVSSYDRMERAAKKYGTAASNQMDKVSRHADHASTALRNASKHGYNFGAIVKGILAANAIRGGIGMIASGFTNAASSYLDFDDTLVSAAAKFDDIGFKSKNFGKQLDDLKGKVRSWAVGTRYNITEVADAVHVLSEAGWTEKITEGIMPYTIKAATANREKNLGEFTDAMAGVFSGFNLKTGDPVKDSQRYVTLLDQITQGAIDARGGIADLKESLKVLAPIWQSSETPAATIAFASTLQNAGFPQDMVATAGKNAVMRMARPDIQEQLAAGGIDITDPKTGKMKAMVDIYADIQKRMDQLGVKPGSIWDRQINQMLFGLYAVAGNQSMMQHLKDYRKEIERVEKESKGVAGGVADKIQEVSSMSKVLALGSVAMDKMVSVFEAFNGPGQKGIEGLTERIKNFNTKPLIDGLSAVGQTLKVVWSVVEPLLPAMPYLLGLWALFATGQKILAGVKFLDEVHKVAKGVGMIEKVMGAGSLLGGVKALGAALLTVSTPLIAIAAVAGTLSALWSASTGKDNPISKIAQALGLVPELQTDSEGRVGPALFEGNSTDYAPNAGTAQAKQELAQKLRANMRVEFANPPAGMKANGQPVTPASPWVQMQMLGANP